MTKKQQQQQQQKNKKLKNTNEDLGIGYWKTQPNISLVLWNEFLFSKINKN